MFVASRAAAALRALPRTNMRMTLSIAQRRSYQLPAAAPAAESFMSGANSIYIDEMYESWKHDPKSVHKSWDAYFRGIEAGLPPLAAFTPPPGLVGASAPANMTAVAAPGSTEKEIKDHLAVNSLIRAYQVRGHNVANLDPLGILDADLSNEIPFEIQYQHYGFTDADLDRTFWVGSDTTQMGKIAGTQRMKLRDIISFLESTYCGEIGYEYMHINSREKCAWLRQHIEQIPPPLPADEKKVILKRLLQADGFERFLQTKWSSEKRFGLEGLESTIPGLKAIIDTAGDLGVENVVLGMPHRGRLNVLANVLQKKKEHIFAEFSADLDPAQEGSGDVKYHLGSSHDRVTRTGKTIHLSLIANPSHLEAVDPVVVGKARAEQFYRGDTDRSRVMPILLHGDAAFSGQGVVWETLNLGDLPHYNVGGTIHIVTNNQIGFTTDPRFSRSSPYATDIAKGVNAPIFHVNADDPEAVVRVCNLAVQWRQRYKQDVVVDIIGYRRHGHNEIDQPAFTQPKMYASIEKHPSAIQVYKERLIKEGVITEEEFHKYDQEFIAEMQAAYEKSKQTGFVIDEWLDSRWKGFKSAKDRASIFNTGVAMDTLKHIGKVISTIPKGFTPHSGVKRVYAARAKAIETGEGIDWATAEAMAFGSLLLEDYHVRLSGQDVERGTFSQRHHVLHDQKSEDLYTPLAHLSKDQAPYSVSNSSLSEYGCLGFELGYSLANPNALVLWEAQFGDFANTAQVIFDQFISSMEQKWLRQTGLTVLLPHGYEGAGPEHSSGRLERFLQQIDEDEDLFPTHMEHSARSQIQETNFQVLNCSTPANYYHALRRQVHREFRKPLIVMTPKHLLRLRACTSTLQEMAEGTRFRRLINEEHIAPGPNVKKLIFCSGKVKYDILDAREAAGLKDQIAVASIEQIAPFPFDLVQRQADDYPNAEIVWMQEEPKNMGAWSYVRPRIQTALKKSSAHAGKEVGYIGRKPSASTATGIKKQHKIEEKQMLKEAMAL